MPEEEPYCDAVWNQPAKQKFFRAFRGHSRLLCLASMQITILNHEIRLAHLQTRMPFRYGIASMTHVPLAFIALDVAVDGKRGSASRARR